MKPLLFVALLLDMLWNLNPVKPQPTLAELSQGFVDNAIVAQVRPIQLEYKLIPSAPYGWLGAVDGKCSPVIYINAGYRNLPTEPVTIAHEMAHIYTRCANVSRGEEMAELLALEVLASLDYDSAVVYGLRRIAILALTRDKQEQFQLSDMEQAYFDAARKNWRYDQNVKQIYLPVLMHILSGKTVWQNERFYFRTDDLYLWALENDVVDPPAPCTNGQRSGMCEE